eukprot:4152356-Prymnesium_polylepis.1
MGRIRQLDARRGPEDVPRAMEEHVLVGLVDVPSAHKPCDRSGTVRHLRPAHRAGTVRLASRLRIA